LDWNLFHRRPPASTPPARRRRPPRLLPSLVRIELEYSSDRRGSTPYPPGKVELCNFGGRTPRLHAFAAFSRKCMPRKPTRRAICNHHFPRTNASLLRLPHASRPPGNRQPALPDWRWAGLRREWLHRVRWRIGYQEPPTGTPDSVFRLFFLSQRIGDRLQCKFAASGYALARK